MELIIIEIDGITPPTPATDYMINWVDVASGAVVPPAMITMDGLVISGVPSGNYRVEVTDINDVNANAGCTASATFFVPDTPPIISLETIATTPDTNCNVDDGTAVVTALSLDTPTDYTYEWLDSDGTTLIAGVRNCGYYWCCTGWWTLLAELESITSSGRHIVPTSVLRLLLNLRLLTLPLTRSSVL